MTKTGETSAPAPAASQRELAKTALLDAAERLLIEEGHAALSTRRVAQEAGVNHGLVHYYFGSMEELLVEVLERFTERLIERQRAMYSADIPFSEKWRAAWSFHDQDLEAGYPKIWHELQALAWNRPELRERVARVNGEWRAVLGEALAQARLEYGLEPDDDPPPEAMLTLVMLIAQGAQIERLSGIDTGHGELLAWIDHWLEQQEARTKA